MLLFIHLDSPNFIPRAWIGAFSVTTALIHIVLTGPDTFEATQLNQKNLKSQKLLRAALGGMTGILILPVVLILLGAVARTGYKRVRAR